MWSINASRDHIVQEGLNITLDFCLFGGAGGRAYVTYLTGVV
jgi:hypothetical protein